MNCSGNPPTLFNKIRARIIAGIKWICRIPCQETSSIIAPTVIGARASPILAPTPCTARTKPRLSGKRKERIPVAPGYYQIIQTIPFGMTPRTEVTWGIDTIFYPI